MEPATSVAPTIAWGLPALTKKLTSPEVISEICDTIFADLAKLRDEARRVGADTIATRHNYPGSSLPYIAPSGWARRDRKEWYQGYYIGIGLDCSKTSSLGFMTGKVVDELRRRLEAAQEQYYREEPREVLSIGGAVHIQGEIFQTKDGIFQVEHTHSWYVKIRYD
ncbi:MAG: hypothetical protein JWL87_462 [Candidatus Adlerbacteria bacterium]|nr:hypothetical protein [Candidatus Adlerbacteria bacterium]